MRKVHKYLSGVWVLSLLCSSLFACQQADDGPPQEEEEEVPPISLSFLGQVGGVANMPIPNTESLQVSNFVTNDALPATSAFAGGNADPDNFRIEVVDPTVAGPSVQVKLQKVLAGVPFGPEVTYTLDKKMGAQFRGEYLRLVSDDVDDAAPGAGDPGNQSLLVTLGDSIRITYTPPAGAAVVRELAVCRPSDESNNGPNKRLHDLRTINFAFKGFVGALPQEPFTDGNRDGLRDTGEANLDILGAGATAGFDANMSAAQMASYEAILMANFNARLAQACVIGQSTSNYAVPLPAGVNLLNGIEVFNAVENPTGPFDLSIEIRALLVGAGVRSAVNSDVNATNDVLDVLFVYNLRTGLPPNGLFGAAALVDLLEADFGVAPLASYHGTILYGSEQFGMFVSHYTLAHESCHIVFNQEDHAANMPTAAQRPGAAAERDMVFPELAGNPRANAVNNSGKRQSYQIPGHPGQVQTYRGNTAYVRD